MATPALRIRIAPKFPTKVQAGVGIGVARTGGVITIKQDWSTVQEGVIPPDLDDYDVLFRSRDTNQLERVPMSEVVTHVGNFASQAEAEGGTATDKPLNALRTKQAIIAQGSQANWLQSGTGAVTRSLQDKLRESVTPFDFGSSVGASEATNDTAFARVKARAPGQVVDLLGGDYAVSVEPDGFQGHNANLIIGGVPKTLPRVPLAHPYAGSQPTTIKEDGNLHYWPGPLLDWNGKRYAVWIEGIAHEPFTDANPAVDPGGGSWIKFGELVGGEIRNETVIFSQSDLTIQHVQGCVMSGNKIALLASCFEPGPVPKLIGLTTTDLANWTKTDLAMDHQWSLGYGPAVPGASATQADYYGYETGGGTYKIIRFRTTDNAATYASSVVLSGSGEFAEAWVEKIDATRQIMVARDDTGGAARISLSTNGGNSWGAFVSSGLPIGANPISTALYGGRLYVTAFARNAISGRSDCLVYWSTSVEKLWTAGGVWPAADRGLSVMATGARHMIGYLYATRGDGNRAAWWMEREDDVGSSFASASRLVIMQNDPTPVASPSIIMQLRPSRNRVRNGCFQLWTRGNSFSGITGASAKIMNGFFVDPSGGTISISRSDVPRNISRLFPHAPRYGCSVDSTAGPDDYMGIAHRITDIDEIYRLADRKLSVQLWGYGGSGAHDTFVSVYTGVGGSPASVSTPTAVMSGKTLQFGAWHKFAQLRPFSLLGVTLGTGAFLTVYVRNSDTTAWTGQLCGLKLEPGDPTPLVPDEGDDIAYNEQFLELMSFPSGPICVLSGNGTAIMEGILKYGVKKRTAPLIIPSSQTAISVGGAIATTALSFANIMRGQAQLLTTMASGTFGAGDLRTAYANQPLDLLIDAEPAP